MTSRSPTAKRQNADANPSSLKKEGGKERVGTEILSSTERREEEGRKKKSRS